LYSPLNQSVSIVPSGLAPCITVVGSLLYNG
jgi:hypothetical protein